MRFRAIIAMTGLLAAILVGGCSPEAMKKAIDRANAEEVDDILLRDPTYSRSFTYIRDHMPADYARLRSGVMARVEAGKTRPEIGHFIFDFANRLTVEHTPEFIAASSPALARYRTAQIALFEALQTESLPLCGYFAEPVGPAPNIAVGVQSQSASEGVLYAQLLAEVDGQTSKLHRDAPTRAIFRAQLEAMKLYGVTHDDLMAFTTEKTFGALSDDRKCDLTIKVLKSINSLPPKQADPLTVVEYKAASRQAAKTLEPVSPGV